MDSNINILITSVGRRTKLLEYFKKELGSKGFLITADSSNLAPAMYISDKNYVIPRISDPEYKNAIMQICRTEKVKGILSLIDPELSMLASFKEELAAEGVIPIVSDYNVCETFLDKYASYSFFKANGFMCAKTYLGLEEFKAAFLKGEIGFPVFVKPRKGSASLGISIVSSLDTLEVMLKNRSDLIIQEFFEGQELGIDVYVDMLTQKTASIFIKEKLAMRAGETDKAKSTKSQWLFKIVQELVSRAGLIGPVDIDVFANNDVFYISEINPRFGGGYPLAYECGVNFPRLIINNLSGISNEPQVGNYDENVYMLKHDSLTVIKKTI